VVVVSFLRCDGKAYFFAIFGFSVGSWELQMCMAFGLANSRLFYAASIVHFPFGFITIMDTLHDAS